MSRIFISRPIFAWVIAIMAMLLGLGSLLSLPVEQFPDVAPPQVNIRASYPGASAETLENSVTQVIEQQLTGIDGLLSRIQQFAADSTSGEPALVSRERDAVALRTAEAAVRAALGHFAAEDLAAEDLRISADALARLLGRMDAESVLDRLFSAFCIGK